MGGRAGPVLIRSRSEEKTRGKNREKRMAFGTPIRTWGLTEPIQRSRLR